MNGSTYRLSFDIPGPPPHKRRPKFRRLFPSIESIAAAYRKGGARAVFNVFKGCGVQSYDPKENIHEAEAIAAQYRWAVDKLRQEAKEQGEVFWLEDGSEGRDPWTSPITMYIIASFEVPKSKPNWFRDAALFGVTQHTKKPDGDNIAKAIQDALEGHAYKHDAQIHHMEVRKQYAKEPRTEVTIVFHREVTKEIWQGWVAEDAKKGGE